MSLQSIAADKFVIVRRCVIMSNIIRRIFSGLRDILNDLNYAMERSFEYNCTFTDKLKGSPKWDNR